MLLLVWGSDVPGWLHAQESMAVEAAELAKASFGATMLGAVGRVYALQGEIGGSNPLNGFIAGMRQRSQTVKTQASAALLAVKVRAPPAHRWAVGHLLPCSSMLVCWADRLQSRGAWRGWGPLGVAGS